VRAPGAYPEAWKVARTVGSEHGSWTNCFMVQL
jgi:hypothetical protein